MACPNINLDSWKNLVAARGEDIAYYLWDKYDGTVPQDEYIKIAKPDILIEAEEKRSEVEKAFSNDDSIFTYYGDEDMVDSFGRRVNPIDTVELAKEYRGKGLGTLKYIIEGEKNLEKGMFMTSDPSQRVSNDAVKIWNKLISFNLAKKEGDRYYYTSFMSTSFETKPSILQTITPSEPSDELAFQLEDMAASRASEETLNKVKEAAKKMGIDIQSLVDYAKAHPEIDTKGVAGVADMVRGVIAVAEGRADVALTEEMVHLATAILEQTNPKLVTEMIKKIDRFKIYKQVFEAYKGRKEYQLSDGRPDIRKIKKEAVDKLIAEVIINRSEGSTEFPELMEEENISMVQKMWDAIKDFFRGMYSKANINIFEEAASAITGPEDIGTVASITREGIFLQTANPKVDAVYDKFKSTADRMQLVAQVGDEKRHYTIDGKKIAKTVTEKIKENVNMPERTGLDKFLDDQKRDWGSEGHSYLENYIRQNLVDENGYARTTPLDVKIDTKIDSALTSKIEGFAKELIASYAPGTRFLIETRAVNERVKGMVASTIDFIAIEPVTTADGKSDVKIDILDWKFANINKNRTEDIPFYKQDEWKKQMSEYVKMAINYGFSPNQIRKARMIPFVAGYTNKVKDTPSSGLNLTSLEIGKLDNVKETNLYLLPVPVNSESTGNKKIDSLLGSLRQYYDKVWETVVSPEEKSAKYLKLDQISAAIRNLHLRLDFSPLIGVGETFLKSAAKTLKEFEGLDFAKLSAEELRKKLGDVLDYQRSAEKFASLDDMFLSHIPKEKLTAEDKKTLDRLEKISAATDRMVDKLIDIQREFVVQLGMKEGFTTEETKMSVLEAEREVDGLSKTFLEGSKLGPKLIRMASNLIMYNKRAAARKTKALIEDFGKLLLPLEQEAAAQGKSAFDMIGRVKNGKLSLIKKISDDFWESKTAAEKTGNKQFFIDNMDMELYRKLADEAIEKEIAELDIMTFSTDPEENDNIRGYKIKKIKDSLDISRGSFNGYSYWRFKDIFNKTMFEEKHLSEEYKQMAKNKAALDVWNFMAALNVRARQSGYLTNQSNSFFPLMEASILQKMFMSTGQGKIKDFFQDMYTVRVNEERGYGKPDPETGEVVKNIPRFFLRTDKDVTKLSKDLTKVGSTWIKALIDYETSKSLEFTLLTMHSVEKAKGKLLLDSSNNVIMEAGVPKVSDETSKNTELLQTIIDDEVYGITENLDSLGNAVMNTAIGKMSKSDEVKESRVLTLKKIMSNSNTLTQALAIGWKATIAIPNYLGYHLQTFINKGDFYREREFLRNHVRVVTGLSTIEKGLIDMMIPLTEDISQEERRKIAKKQGYIKWLGTWNFSDVMMATNSFPERKLQLTNALSMIENSMVVDGKIVNIRQYVRKQDLDRYKTMSEADRKALERTQEERIAKLKEEKSLIKVAKIENDSVVLDGVSDEEIAKFSVRIIEYGRNMNGMMNNDNKADYRRDTIFRSFMMFKNWIPKQLYVRGGDIQKNDQLEEWEYGRTRLFVKVWSQLGFRNILEMREIVQGTDKGLRLMDELLEDKKRTYFQKTGKTLEITNEEFYDLVRNQLSRQVKELGLLLSITAFFLTLKAMVPPDDEDKLANNRFKYFAKILNKTQDELAFYYKPTSFDSITKGSLFPFLGVLYKAEKIIDSVLSETYGTVTGSEEISDKAYPIKYFMDIIPGASQFNREILPLIDAEMAKELGIRVTEQARIR